jgi:hypothetical protein
VAGSAQAGELRRASPACLPAPCSHTGTPIHPPTQPAAGGGYGGGGGGYGGGGYGGGGYGGGQGGYGGGGGYGNY